MDAWEQSPWYPWGLPIIQAFKHSLGGIRMHPRGTRAWCLTFITGLDGSLPGPSSRKHSFFLGSDVPSPETMAAARPGHLNMDGSCSSCLHHVPNTRQAPSRWSLVIEWKTKKDLLQLRKETPVVWMVSPVGMSNSGPTVPSLVCAHRLGCECWKLVLSACQCHISMASTRDQWRPRSCQDPA